MKFFKIVLGSVLGASGIVCLLLGSTFFLHTPSQIRSDLRFKERFEPVINYVESFYDENSRFPSSNEFEEWKIRNGWENYALFLYVQTIPGDPEFRSQVTENEEYIISMWRGEWNVFYISQEKRFFPGGWGYDDALGQFIFCAAIGGSFLLGSWFLLHPKYIRPNKAMDLT